MTLAELVQRWLGESRGLVAPGTIAHYGSLMEAHVLPRLGPAPDISEAEIEAFVSGKLSEGLSEATVFMLLRLLKRVLDYGASIGACAAPAWSLSLKTPQKKRGVVILSEAEEQQLCTYLAEHPSEKHLCIFLLLTCGLSVGEVLTLRWEDVSINKKELRVASDRGPVKNRRNTARTVPLTERERIYLRKFFSLPGNYLSSGTPEPLNRQAIEDRWRILIREVKLPPLSLTCLRHTFAVRALEGGMNYPDLSERLGLDNSRHFRAFYRSLVNEEHRERLEREHLEGRKVRQAPAHITPPAPDPELAALREKTEVRKKELKEALDSLEGDLAIIRTLRNSDCVQGAPRQGFYHFVEKVLGSDDKDGKLLVEYLRSNMRIADMPSRAELSVQTIRRRISRGFARLCERMAAFL